MGLPSWVKTEFDDPDDILYIIETKWENRVVVSRRIIAAFSSYQDGVNYCRRRWGDKGIAPHFHYIGTYVVLYKMIVELKGDLSSIENLYHYIPEDRVRAALAKYNSHKQRIAENGESETDDTGNAIRSDVTL